jgi:CBS domain-containing protein
MTCKDVMTTNVATCSPQASTQAAALIMSEEDVGIVPVVDPETQRLVGVVTDRDLCLDVVAAGKHPRETHVSDSLHAQPVTCRPDDSIDTCLHLMQQHRVRRIPIVDDEGLCIGIVSQKDIALRVPQPHAVHETMREISRPVRRSDGG